MVAQEVDEKPDPYAGVATALDRRAVALVLSAGRTGTKFLSEYLDSGYPDVTAKHEPKPSRSLRLTC